ncbi:diaminopimelate decarboxylase [Marinibaculum pumilum]|uniref:Diaminopimelate decarboxylase n=1 Tax=Marinibaculum pumilum TaxID=1766165 RepID=A0ABV7LAK7_9PROT
MSTPNTALRAAEPGAPLPADAVPALPGAPHFAYRGGRLMADEVPLEDVAEAAGTPVFVYSRQAVLDAAEAYRTALAELPATICYAMKANGNGALLRSLATAGLGVDVVSAGEMKLALRAGFPASRIVFSGVGKTAAEIGEALDAGIAHLNVESEAELEAVAQVAAQRGKVAHILLRVNPDVAAATHEKIATGHKATKFGIALEHAPALYARAAADPWLEPIGIAAHIGSQIIDMSPYRTAFGRMAELVDALRGQGLTVTQVDLGGGIGIRYRDEPLPDLAAYGAIVREIFGHRDVEILIEPGRSLVGNAGVLLTRVIYVKKSGGKTFVVVDAAMNDLIRPTLYDAWHEIVPVHPAPGAPVVPVDVVGPVCETGDYLARNREMPEPVAGSLLAVMSAGAYAAVMASSYNARPLAPEVLVDGGRHAVVRRRPTMDEMTALEAVPDWLAPAPPQGDR